MAAMRVCFRVRTPSCIAKEANNRTIEGRERYMLGCMCNILTVLWFMVGNRFKIFWRRVDVTRELHGE